MNTCDYSHQTRQEVRLLPTGGDGNMIVCKRHYEREIQVRIQWARDQTQPVTVDLPKWESLKIYAEEITE